MSNVDGEAQTPNLNVAISVSFPQSEIFGVKLINGHATEARLSVTNNEPTPIGVNLVGGSLVQEVAGQSQIVRNLTAQRYSIEIPAGAEETVPYTFSTELHPQDLRLQLVAVLKDDKNAFYTVSVYNETVSIVEAPTSFFDPQMFAFSPLIHLLVTLTNVLVPASFSILFCSAPSLELSILSTIPGSLPSFPRKRAVARVVNVLRNLPLAQRKSTPPIKLPSLVLMALLLPVAPRRMMRAGSLLLTSSAPKLNVFAAARRRSSPKLRFPAPLK